MCGGRWRDIKSSGYMPAAQTKVGETTVARGWQATAWAAARKGTKGRPRTRTVHRLGYCSGSQQLVHNISVAGDSRT